MEIDGEGGGGEAERRGRSELGRLLEAIGSSEVLEKRIPLIKQLEELSADDLGLILQVLLASWVDSTCSGVSHCALHKSILQVVLKCSDLDITEYLGQFLTLAAKASSWCGRHLQCSVKSIDQSQVAQEEEHNKLRLEITALSFSISTKLHGIAAKRFTVLGLEVAAGEDGPGAVAEDMVALPCGVGASLDAFFDHAFNSVSSKEAGPVRAEEEEELEWLSNRDAFPSVDTMATVEVEEAPAPAARRARTKGRRRVTANAVQPRRRCTHCGTEETPQWREGPEGARTLCNACGVAFKKNGRLLSEYRPAKSPGFSPLLHSNTHRRVLQMHRQNKTTSARHGEARSALTMEGHLLPPANGPASSSPLQRHSPLCQERLQSAGHATAEACPGEKSVEVQLLPELPPVDRSAFSLVYHRRVLERPPVDRPAFSLVCRRHVPEMHSQNGEKETSLAGRATSEACRGEARHESIEVQLLPDSPAFSQLLRSKNRNHIGLGVLVLSRGVQPCFKICTLNSVHCRKPLLLHPFLICQSLQFYATCPTFFTLSHFASTDSAFHHTRKMLLVQITQVCD